MMSSVEMNSSFYRKENLDSGYSFEHFSYPICQVYYKVMFSLLYTPFIFYVCLPQLILRLKSLMIDRPSAFIVKLEPSSKLNETVDFSSLDVDFPTSVPSIITLTSPWLLQLPNLSFALPLDQNVVDIIEVDHPCTSQLEPGEPSRSFKSHRFPRKTNRFLSSILSKSQPLSFIDS